MNDRRSPKAFDLPKVETRAAAPPADLPPEPFIAPRRAEPDVRAPRAVPPDRIVYDPDPYEREVAVLETEAELALVPRRRGGPWAALAVAALTGLIGIAVGLWIEGLITELFRLTAAAGLLGLVLAAILAVAVFVMLLREALALRRLRSQFAVRERARKAVAANDARAAGSIASDLMADFAERPETAAGRDALRREAGAIMNASDRLALVERHLLAPLDEEARRVVLRGAQRVSLVTAVAPRALIDVLYVALENARTVRAVAAIYGLRPGRLGFLRLLRDVLGHLAVTGTIAVGDGIIGEAVGHGVASRLSSRLGEGVVNGLLTARVGIAAMDLCRPLPFEAEARPTVGRMARSIARREGGAGRSR